MSSNGIPSKVKWKMHMFYILFQVLKELLVKSYKAQLPVLLFLVVLYQLCQGIKFLALSMRCLCSAYFAQLFVSQKCLPIESYFLPVQTKEDHIWKETPTQVFSCKYCEIKACSFIQKRLQHQVFSCEYCKLFKNSFFIEHLWWLSLYRQLKW